jgi:hypothetical protein
MHSHSRWHQRSQLPPTYHLCKLDSISFTSAFQSDSAGAYLVQTKDDISPVVLKFSQKRPFYCTQTKKRSRFGPGSPRCIVKYTSMTIPPHPNILGPPVALVTVPCVDNPVVCGFLSPFHPGGTIAYALSPFSPDSKPPSLARRIR